MDSLIERILHGYRLKPERILPVQSGYRNLVYPAELTDGSVVNLMLYKTEPGILDRIKRANRVGNFVSRHGLPARRTYSSRIVRVSRMSGDTYGAVYDYLPGHTIPWEAYTMKHIKLLGKTMSDMHAILQSFDATELPDVADEYIGVVKRMQSYFNQQGVKQASAAKLKLVLSDGALTSSLQLLYLCKKLPSQQALHMDFVRSNILFEVNTSNPVVSGVLDFEKTARGHCIFDIARTLAFLLVDCKYKPEEKIRKYFLQSGYQKRGIAAFRNITIAASAKKTNVLEGLIDVFLLYDYYKFLRHNPYEFLLQNEHFVRTRDLLVRRGLVQKVAKTDSIH